MDLPIPVKMAYYRVNFAVNYIATIKELKQEEYDPKHTHFHAPDGTLLNIHVEAADEQKAYEAASEVLKAEIDMAKRNKKS